MIMIIIISHKYDTLIIQILSPLLMLSFINLLQVVLKEVSTCDIEEYFQNTKEVLTYIINRLQTESFKKNANTYRDIQLWRGGGAQTLNSLL